MGSRATPVGGLTGLNMMDIKNSGGGSVQTGGGSVPSTGVSERPRAPVPALEAKAPQVETVQKSAVETAQKSPAEARPHPVALQSAVDNINKAFKLNNTTLQFKVDASTKRNVVQVLDSSTGKVISQYPTEVTLAISRAIDREMKQGVLINQSV